MNRTAKQPSERYSAIRRRPGFAALLIAGCITYILPVVLSAAPEQQAEQRSVQLVAQPARCVALREGQLCYLNLVISWKSSDDSDYCLYEEGVDHPLRCWTGSNKGAHHIDFESNHSVVYRLRDEVNIEKTFETVVTVSWVYASNTRKTNWRLF